MTEEARKKIEEIKLEDYIGYIKAKLRMERHINTLNEKHAILDNKINIYSRYNLFNTINEIREKQNATDNEWRNFIKTEQGREGIRLALTLHLNTLPKSKTDILYEEADINTLYAMTKYSNNQRLFEEASTKIDENLYPEGYIIGARFYRKEYFNYLAKNILENSTNEITDSQLKIVMGADLSGINISTTLIDSSPQLRKALMDNPTTPDNTKEYIFESKKFLIPKNIPISIQRQLYPDIVEGYLDLNDEQKATDEAKMLKKRLNDIMNSEEVAPEIKIDMLERFFADDNRDKGDVRIYEKLIKHNIGEEATRRIYERSDMSERWKRYLSEKLDINSESTKEYFTKALEQVKKFTVPTLRTYCQAIENDMLKQEAYDKIVNEAYNSRSHITDTLLRISIKEGKIDADTLESIKLNGKTEESRVYAIIYDYCKKNDIENFDSIYSIIARKLAPRYGDMMPYNTSISHPYIKEIHGTMNELEKYLGKTQWFKDKSDFWKVEINFFTKESPITDKLNQDYEDLLNTDGLLPLCDKLIQYANEYAELTESKTKDLESNLEER